MRYILKHALAGAVFAAGAVIAGAITWTALDKKQHGQRRRLEEGLAAYPPLPAPRAAVEESDQLPSSPYTPKTVSWGPGEGATVTFAYPPPVMLP